MAAPSPEGCVADGAGALRRRDQAGPGLASGRAGTPALRIEVATPSGKAPTRPERSATQSGRL
jgi:hypothetical protein